MNRKPLLSVARYVATISIAAYHFEGLYMQGPVFLGFFYIWVEFFFVMSGFFVGIYDKNKETDCFERIKFWVKKQLKKQYPLYILAAFVNFAVQIYIARMNSFRIIIMELFEQRWEYLGLVPFFPNAKVYNIVGPAQQIPITIIGGVACMLLGKIFSKGKHVIFPIMSMGTILLIVVHFGNISQWTSRIGFIPTGIARGVSEMLFGYWLSTEVLPRINLDKYVTIIKIFGELLGAASVLLLIGMRNASSYRWLASFVVLYGIWIIAMYCTDIKKTWLVNATILEKLTYPMFLFHGAILSLMYFKWPNYGYIMIIPFMLVLHFVAALAYGLNIKMGLMRHQ